LPQYRFVPSPDQEPRYRDPLRQMFVLKPILELGLAARSAVSKGQTVATAVGIATEATPKFQATSNLALLEDARVVVGIQEAA
jgi:hypothetical protein